PGGVRAAGNRGGGVGTLVLRELRLARVRGAAAAEARAALQEHAAALGEPGVALLEGERGRRDHAPDQRCIGDSARLARRRDLGLVVGPGPGAAVGAVGGPLAVPFALPAAAVGGFAH